MGSLPVRGAALAPALFQRDPRQIAGQIIGKDIRRMGRHDAPAAVTVLNLGLLLAVRFQREHR